VELAIGIRSGIGGIFEDGVNGREGRAHPVDVFGVGRTHRRGSWRDWSRKERRILWALPRRSNSATPGGGYSAPAVGMQNHFVLRNPHQSNWQAQVAARPRLALLRLGCPQLGAQRIPLRLGKGAFQPQQQAVIVDARIVNAGSVADQGAYRLARSSRRYQSPQLRARRDTSVTRIRPTGPGRRRQPGTENLAGWRQWMADLPRSSS